MVVVSIDHTSESGTTHAIRECLSALEDFATRVGDPFEFLFYA